jgi:hypothetical protein
MDSAPNLQKNRIGGGNANLDWETGKLTIRNFSNDDVGSYTFPLEEQRMGLAKTLIVVELDG